MSTPNQVLTDMFSRLRTSLTVAAFSAVPALLAAQGIILPPPCGMERQAACPIVNSQVVRTGSDVRVELIDGVLQYAVRETFVNRGTRIGEADYVFPLPKNAAFQNLELMINGEPVAGETMAADRARSIYEGIVRSKRDPALVEWMGYGMLRARIFPIAPGEEKVVTVRFHSVAEHEGDALRIEYVRGTQPVEARATNEASGTRLTLSYPDEDRYGRPFSPTHSVTTGTSRGRRTAEARGSAPNVTILLPVRRGAEPAISALTYNTGSEDGFALITLSPPALTPRRIPRDITLVLDVSGSMSGAKMNQARAAGKQLLGTLDATDRFRLIDFSTDVRTFRDAMSPATRENLRAADQWLDGLVAEGSTNISAALEEALAPAADPERLAVVLFVTDGEPTVGERNPDAIATRVGQLRGSRRVFSFGVGADLNAALVERLAIDGHGTAQFVRPEESVERAVGLVASRLTSPVLTDVRVSVDGRADPGVRLDRTYPSGGSDLFAGQDLVVLTRYHGAGQARLAFDARTANGTVHWTQDVDFPDRARANSFVARLWATQRVGYLSADRRRNGANPEIDAEIRDLGTRYGIPTELSSYLVVEPGMMPPANLMTDQSVRRGAGAGGGGGGGGRAGGGRGGQALQGAQGQQGQSPQSGAVAVSQASQAAQQRAVTTLAEADAMQALAKSERRASERFFAERDSVWTDSRVTPSTPRVKLQAYSDAYFAVLALYPELREAFALGDRLVVAGKSVAIELTPTGATKLSDADAKTLREKW